MGEALIARRGGGIRMGTVANVATKTMSDPALVGCRNAIILAQKTTYAQSGSNYIQRVTTIVIENGAISTVGTVQRISTQNSGGYSVYAPPADGRITFDPTSGTITAFGPEYTGGLEFSFDGGTSSTSFMQTYRYHVWD